MHNASESAVRSRQGGARVRVPPPVWFALAIVVGALLPGLRLGIVASGPPGALLVATAVALLLWSVRWFRRTGQDLRAWTPSPELIHRGPYRFSRNPMYVGMTMFTIGIAGVLARGWIALLAPLALLAVHRTAVVREEAYLSETFGEPYREYMKRVRRYL
jgi:protein-S-isoprenylcysteine O-methyltransferase Ste14